MSFSTLPSPPRWARAALVASLLLGVAAGASAREASHAALRLEDVSGGRAGKAHVHVRTRLDEDAAHLRLHAWRLAPGDYVVTADDVPFASFTADRRGRAHLRVDLREVQLDPRGRLVSVADEQGDLLAGVVSGPLEPRRAWAWEQTELVPSDAAGPGRAWLRFTKSFFRGAGLVVRTAHAPAGLYEVQLDGVPFGHLDVRPDGWGRAEFRELYNPLVRFGWGWLFRRPFVQPLPEDPRGGQLALRRDGEVLFAGPVRARIDGLEPEPAPPPSCTPGLVELRMEGSGDAALRHGFDEDCRGVLEIELAFVAAGDYTVLRNGEVLGSFAVGGFSGSVRFATDPTGEELPLASPVEPGDRIEVAPAGGAPQLSLVIP